MLRLGCNGPTTCQVALKSLVSHSYGTMSSPPIYEAGTRTSALLPAYSSRDSERHSEGGSRASTEHIFSPTDGTTKTRGTLRLFSSASTPASLPTFLEGDQITGSLSLNVFREKIVGLTILIRGEITIGPQRQHRLRFLNVATPLWSKAEGRLGEMVTLPSGDCSWPFSIDIPKEVIIPDPDNPGAVRSYSLPQTFLERNTRASAHYSISVQIVRSGIFSREDNEHETMFVYVPALRPDPPSPLRQLAYQENAPIPGPEIDQDGWHTCPPVILKGTVFNDRKVEVQCVLSLSKPLSYTRGSVIPCSIIYTCRDVQALNLLCTPSATNVCLHRQVKCRSLSLRIGSSLAVDDVEEISRAVWWPARSGPQYQDSRKFEGEIHLPKHLKPTSAISHFTLQYFVVILPIKVTGFVSADPHPLIQQEVQIATIFAKGPRARHYAPIQSQSRKHNGHSTRRIVSSISGESPWRIP
ncbi:hypothetical protein B0H11DRAFT_1947754 [Mycena galericulata]|nr:hypothetical protein B0H11DRAFT_1947754 [Mycena galericulata]